MATIDDVAEIWKSSQVKPINMSDRTIKSTQCSVNSPSHYTSGGIEAIDYIKAKLGTDGCIAYCLGNVIKYVSRAGKKDIQKELEDLKKAQWYLNKAVQLSSTDDDYYVS